MKKWTTLAMLMAAAAFTSCQKTDANEGAVIPGEDTRVTITLTNAGDTKAPTGSEDGTGAENAIKTLEIYVFDANGNPDPKLGAGVAGNDGNGYYKVTDPDKPQSVIVSSGTGKTFVAVVNMNLGPLAMGKKYTDLKAMLAAGQFKATLGGSDHNARETTTGLEMLGEKANVEIKEAEINQRVTIAVDRLVSKLVAPTFKNGNAPASVVLTAEDIEAVWGENSGITTDKISFQFDGYSLINGITKSHLYFVGNTSGVDTDIPWAIDHAVWAVGKSYLNSAFNGQGFYTNNYGGYGNADWFLEDDNEEAVYFYENKPGKITVNGQTGYNPLQVYALMVKGTLKVAGNSTLDTERYWRINLTRDDDYHILRNSVYRVNVKSIKSPGHGTPEAAEKEDDIIPGKGDSAADVTIVVNKWRVNFYEYEM